MTKIHKHILDRVDHGIEAKGAMMPAPVDRGAKAEPMTGRGVEVAAGVVPLVNANVPQASQATSVSSPPRRTKAALLRARLAEPGGVSMASLMEVTGWQAHTLRAALSGLRKSGLAITRCREGGDTIYAIAASERVKTRLTNEVAADGAEPAAAVPIDGLPICDDATSAPTKVVTE